MMRQWVRLVSPVADDEAVGEVGQSSLVVDDEAVGEVGQSSGG